MRKPRLRPPVRRTRRRWRVPPAITHGSEAFEGAGILEEIPGKLGLLLWQSVRDVTLWAGTPDEAREGLFTPGAEQQRRTALRAAAADPVLEPALAEMAEILSRPRATTGELMARACRRVAEWADERELTATAIAFVQAAALAAPLDADTAYAVARLARRRAEHARAETWYRRAIALARQSGDWSAYSLAFLGLGNLYMQRGSFPPARRLYVRALRAARRHSLHAVAGMIFHDLFVLAVASGRPQEAERAAREAHGEYGDDHPRLCALAHDVAYFWMDQGYSARALSVFEALLPHITRPAERLAAMANLARAAAGTGARTRFEEGWRSVWEGAAEADVQEGASEAFVELAYGATEIGDWTRARDAAERAMRLAAEREEPRTLPRAERVLEAVRQRRSAQAPPAQVEDTAAREADAFAEALVRSLNAAALAE